MEGTLRDIRDAALKAELMVNAVAPPLGDTGIRKMDLGRQMAAPVLPALARAPGEGTAA